MDYKLFLRDIVDDYIDYHVEYTDYNTFTELEDALLSDHWLRRTIMDRVPRHTSLKSAVLRNTEYLADAMSLGTDFDIYDIGRNFLIEDWNWFDKKLKEYLIDDVITETVAEKEDSYDRAWAGANEPENDSNYIDSNYTPQVELSDEDYDEGFDESLRRTAWKYNNLLEG